MTQELRFGFGKNWANFLQHLDESRIQEAINSLKSYLGVDSLAGKTFLDVGSGSGLFSLAAHRLGATVKSFDYDENSVGCTKYLRDTYASDSSWEVFQGSILDDELTQKLGTYDIVYSWGVLHHTGNMYKAFENAEKLVKSAGTLFISIYNDQGLASKGWTVIKKMYVSVPWLRSLIIAACGLWLWKYRITWGLIRYGNPLKFIREYGQNNRGMSAYYDLIDWVGGYPFEVAKPEEVFDFFRKHNFELHYLKTCAGGLGCNEFVLKRKN
jgi:2-polyprenyl-6-hydroxyphenyl methylase/3-demethylubiquinone-9 3-methyltransferase